MKRSQMEIMGLAVIIILLALGLLFVVRFMILKEPSQIKNSFTQTEMAANLVNSVLKTSSGCLGMSISEVLKDCAVSQTPEVCENGDNTCVFANSSLTVIFNETLIKFGNRSFNFVSHLGEDIVLQQGNGDCSGVKEARHAYIPTDRGILTVRLEICS